MAHVWIDGDRDICINLAEVLDFRIDERMPDASNRYSFNVLVTYANGKRTNFEGHDRRALLRFREAHDRLPELKALLASLGSGVLPAGRHTETSVPRDDPIGFEDDPPPGGEEGGG